MVLIVTPTLSAGEGIGLEREVERGLFTRWDLGELAPVKGFTNELQPTACTDRDAGLAHNDNLLTHSRAPSIS